MIFSLVLVTVQKTIDFMRYLGIFETDCEIVQLSALPKPVTLGVLFLIYLTGRSLLRL